MKITINETLATATVVRRVIVCLVFVVYLSHQKLVSLFVTSGVTSLQEFSELDESDLDELHVVQSEDRAKLLTAAQLLHDYENEGFRYGLHTVN